MNNKCGFLRNYWQVAEEIKNTISVKEYAKKYYIHESYVRKLLRAGRIKGFKLQGKWYIQNKNNN